MRRISALLDGQLHAKDVVSRMAGGREGTSSYGGLVDWTNVPVAFVRLFLLVGRKEQHVRYTAVEDLVMRFIHAFQVGIPPGTIQEETVDIAAIFGSLANIVILAVFWNYAEVECQCIDG